MSGTLTGKVLDTNGDPVEGVTVTVADANNSETTTTVSTNGSGDYSTGTIPDNTYDVTANKRGYIPDTKSGQSVSGGTTTVPDHTIQAASYKVRGELTDFGYGVVGVASGTEGEPVGVRGTVPNTDSGYGLSTPDDARVDGDFEATTGHSLTVDGTECLELTGSGTLTSNGDTFESSGNAVVGHLNKVSQGVLGASIGGGGLYNVDSDNPLPNTVTDHFNTIGGGYGNTAGDSDDDPLTAFAATIGGGQNNTVSAQDGTIGGGSANEVSEVQGTVSGGVDNLANGLHATVGGGSENTASGESATVGGGEENVAAGDNATVAGGGRFSAGNEAYGAGSTIGGGSNNRTGKSGETLGVSATIPGGEDNVAEGQTSFAAGDSAKAVHDGSFVWADSSFSSVSSTGDDQFLVEAGGGVGIGTESPVTQFHVRDNVSETGSSNLGRHVVAVQNTGSSNTNDVLGLELPNVTDPGGFHNFISFMDSSGTIGSVQGDGSGNVTFASSSGDIAEYFPKADPDETFEDGDVVGLRGGEVVADPTEAEVALVVSGTPMVAGNVPAKERDDEFARLALLGQVEVTVSEPVDRGSLLVAGVDGRARPVGAVNDEDPAIVGLALASGSEAINALVGRHSPVANERTDSRFEALEAENEQLREENEALRDRLDAVESHLGIAADDTPTPADD